MAKSSIDALIPTMEGWFKPLPNLPKGAVDFIVMIAPWVAIISGILGLLGAIAAFGVISFMEPVTTMYSQKVGLWPIAVIGGVVASILSIMAFPGLRDRKIKGWTIIFWAEVVSTVSTLLGMNLGGVIGALIGFYILFQIKASYK